MALVRVKEHPWIVRYAEVVSGESGAGVGAGTGAGATAAALTAAAAAHINASAVVAAPPAPTTPAAPRFALAGLSSIIKQPLIPAPR